MIPLILSLRKPETTVKKGLLRAGLHFSLPGKFGHTGDLLVTVEETQVLLRDRDGTLGAFIEKIPMTWTLCHFGGQRPWFICPGSRGGHRCGRRVAILYVVGRSFLCRPCGSLVYESQQQDRLTRLEDKARRIRLRLGGDTALNTPFPAKPKRMHWRTYERLRQEGEGAEYALLVALGEKLQHLQQKMDKLALRSACMPT